MTTHTDKCMHDPDFEENCTCFPEVWGVYFQYSNNVVDLQFVTLNENIAKSFVEENPSKHHPGYFYKKVEVR